MSKRDYGHDSIKQSDSTPSKSNVKFKDIIKYNFDNALSKTKNFVVFLVVLSMFLGLIMSLVKYFLLPEDNSFGIDDWWNSFTKILGVGGGDSWPSRLINFLYWSMSVAISGSVIGFIAKGISNITEYLKKGRSQVITENHILILGWSNNIFAIVSELIKANENIKNAKIVIFSSLKNQDMQDLLSLNLKGIKLDNVVTRSGDITTPKDLQIVNPGSAKSIIVLGNNAQNDIEVTLAVMAIYSNVVNTEKAVVVQINEKRSLEYFKRLTGINLIPVFSYDIIVNVCCQAIRQRGIGAVVLDFMDFDGNEIYYYANDLMFGKTYYEAALSFNDASTIGIIRDNKTYLNPVSDSIINPNDKLIVIAEDDYRIKYTGLIKVEKEEKPIIKKTTQKEGNMLTFGWSKFARDVIETFLTFKETGQTIYVLCNESEIHEDHRKIYEGIKFIPYNTENISLNFIESLNITEALILPFSESLSHAETDAMTLIKMVEFNNINRQRKENKIRVIAYLLDSSKVELAGFTETEELIVSDNLSALIIAQYAENPQLLPVFNDIFDAEGASINLINCTDLIEPGINYLYADIVHFGLQKNMSIVGIVRNKINDNSTGVKINIGKNETIVLDEEDKLIIIN